MLHEFREFMHKKTGRKYREGQCNTCRAQYHRSYVWDGAESLRGQKVAIVEERKKSPCADCGGTFPAVCMDFDHVRGVKKTGINQIVAQFWSVDILLEELAKCELVCANCHRIRTHADKALHKQRIRAGRIRAGLPVKGF